MTTNVNIIIAADSADAQRAYKTGGLKQGDLIFQFDKNYLFMVHALGLQQIAIVPAANAVALTSGAGTVSNATSDVGAAFSQATLNNNFASLVGKINELRSKMVAAGLMTGP